MIILDDVCKWFDTGKTKKQIQALSKVSLHIPKGEIIGVIGKSGSGKTTLLKLISGLLVPDSGRIRVMGLDPVKKRRRLSEQISVLFADKVALNQCETVKSNLEMLQSIYKINRNVFEKELSRLSVVFCIEGLMKELVRDLSLGQRRRVELVSHFVLQADLNIMDEPCIGLDTSIKHQYEQIVKELREQRKTVIISSHNMSEIDAICTRIILLDKGKLMFYGEKRELLRQYAPIDVMKVKCIDKLPNMQDLPIINYLVDDLNLTISYDTNHISAAEIIRVILQSTSISEVNVQKPTLEEVIMAIGRK